MNRTGDEPILSSFFLILLTIYAVVVSVGWILHVILTWKQAHKKNVADEIVLQHSKNVCLAVTNLEDELRERVARLEEKVDTKTQEIKNQMNDSGLPKGTDTGRLSSAGWLAPLIVTVAVGATATAMFYDIERRTVLVSSPTVAAPTNYAQQAFDRMRLGRDYPTAKALLEKAAEGGECPSLVARGMVAYFLGVRNYDEAERWVDRLARLPGEYASALNHRGLLAYSRGDKATARQAFLDASQLGNSDALNNLRVLEGA